MRLRPRRILCNFWGLGKSAYRGGERFVTRAVEASRQGCLGNHLRAEAKTAYRDTSTWVAYTSASSMKVARALAANPREVAPELFIIVLTSLLVSGGPDGDGGAPDWDLMAGIGAHRSPLTHSIILGSALETGIFSLLTLVSLVHDKLPAKRDPWWDLAHSWSERIATRAAQGASIGMAYHLLEDGLLQPGTYHDLPFSMPLEAHQGLFVLNAKLEALDVPAKKLAQQGAQSAVKAASAEAAVRRTGGSSKESSPGVGTAPGPNPAPAATVDETPTSPASTRRAPLPFTPLQPMGSATARPPATTILGHACQAPACASFGCPSCGAGRCW